MNTVPTLCASSTIGVAAIGLSFGRPQSPSRLPSRHFPRLLPAAQTQYHGPNEREDILAQEHPQTASGPSDAAIDQQRSLPHQPHGVSRLPSQLTSRSRPPSRQPSNPSTSPSDTAGIAYLQPRKRPMTAAPSSTASASSRSASQTRENVSNLPNTTPRRLPSTLFSRESSHGSDTRPLSRSKTHSSGSVAPLFGASRDANVTPPTRNRLVKRSISQALPNTASSSASSSRPFKRPATSHQRSAQFSQRGHEHDTPTTVQDMDPHGGSGANTMSNTDEKPFRHMFRARIFHSGIRTPQRRLSQGDMGFIKRIVPTGAKPTLMQASLVAPADVEVDWGQFDTDLDGICLPKRPIAFSRPVSRSYPTDESEPKTSVDGGLASQSTPRRSFSINNFLQHTRPSTSAFSSRPGTASSKLRKLGGRRVFSDRTPRTSKSMYMDPGSQDSPGEGSETDVSRPNTQRRLFSSPIAGTHSAGHDPRDHSPMRTSRPSFTPSEFASSVAESDGGRESSRVFSYSGHTDSDARSDTVYDSVRTGTAKSTSHAWAKPPLETLFDKSTTTVDRMSSQHLEIDGQDDLEMTPRHKSSELTTKGSPSPDFGPLPVSVTNHTSPSKRYRTTPPASSPELSNHDSESINWDVSDDSDWHDTNGYWSHEGPDSSGQGKSPFDSTTKPSLFDWSESAPQDRSLEDEDPPRPKTQYGKKNRVDVNAGPSSARRNPSGLHSRSRSVPVLPNLAANRANNHNKFGTWGIGDREVTEDWNDDFDFGGTEETRNTKDDLREDHHPDRAVSIVVPQSIQEQQDNIFKNISLVREFGLLIGELKELRQRALTLGLSTSSVNDQTFEEVEAMIELADQEVEDEDWLTNESPTRAGTHDDFDVEWDRAMTDSNSATNSPRTVASHGTPNIHASPHSPQSSVATTQDSPVLSTRGRKNSEAVARSVIEAIQRKRSPTKMLQDGAEPKKRVHFDSRTLRHLVPYVHGLMRRVKQIVRDTEGLNTTPKAERAESLFNHTFTEPESPSAGKQRKRHERAGTLEQIDEDILSSLQNMSIPDESRH